MSARPAVLAPLFQPLQYLKGVGPKLSEALAKLLKTEQPVVRDLLFHLPSGYVDRRHLSPIAQSVEGIVSWQVTIDKHYPSMRHRRNPYKITVSDESGSAQLVFFNAYGDYVAKQYPVGETRIISGPAELFDGIWQMTHPEKVVAVGDAEKLLKLEPVWPLSAGITQGKLAQLQAQITSPHLPEWIDAELVRQRGWEAWSQAITRLQQPEGVEDTLEDSPLRARLAYDELLAGQLALALTRRRQKRSAGILISPKMKLREHLLDALPYRLTQGQQTIVAEIDRDMASGERMLRLLQGDVGAGKTLVALLAMLAAVESGYQAALMVPTEILGRQHVQGMMRMLEPLGVKVALLSGKLKAAEKKAITAQIASGEIDIIIGTHALFQESVSFSNLALVVIDEQHRFGVKQRLALTSKGRAPHLLLMSATPIPRSLCMIAYGDMDASSLREKPANRLPIDTRTVSLSRLDEVVQAIGRAVADGARAYWICPLVEESEETPGELAAAEERFHTFCQLFGAERVAMAHGRQSQEDRQRAMQRFASGEAQLLVATTVVEVGVDVPEATVMVIEHAERFGLAQLHQLRGRVGRGDQASHCILLYQDQLSENGKARLQILRDSNDGFRIAEEDMRLRGSGDVLGTKQSGLPAFRFVDLALHHELIAIAHDEVKLILHRDPELVTEKGQALKVLLYLFGRDESLRWLRAG